MAITGNALLNINGAHEKLITGIQEMIIDLINGLPYYGEFNSFLNFQESKSLPTCAVNVTAQGMNFYYNSKFLEKLSQKEVNFIIFHEDFHLLFDHPQRTVAGAFNHEISNIVQDMIINYIIWSELPHKYIEIPKDDKGRNMALFVPKEFFEDGHTEEDLIFEKLYIWFKDKQEEWREKNKDKLANMRLKKEEKNRTAPPQQPQQQKSDEKQEKSDKKDKSDCDSQSKCENDGNGKKQDGQGEGDSEMDTSGKPSYGPYAKNPAGDGSIDTYSMDRLFQDIEEGNTGEYLDKHITDEVNGDMRRTMVSEIVDSLRNRGFSSGNIEQVLNKLRKKRKDYLKYIKKNISNIIFGQKKQRTISRPNRRGIEGLKGNRKVRTKINCILDTSGSMGGTFEKVISYIYQNDIEVNFIEADTEVKWVKTLKSKKQIESIQIAGLGGTILQPAVSLVEERFNEYNTVILTDGYCDSLDVSRLKGNVLMISIGQEVPIAASNGKVKQIQVDLSYE